MARILNPTEKFMGQRLGTQLKTSWEVVETLQLAYIKELSNYSCVLEVILKHQSLCLPFSLSTT